MKILLVNGPSLNMLGIREPQIYGNKTYYDLEKMCEDRALELGIKLKVFQSNHEGEIVDEIQNAYQSMDGIIINPGAYSHTSIAILDALKAVGIPTVEVHISDPSTREEFRKTDYIGEYAFKRIVGKGFDGYIEAMDILVEAVNNG